MFQLLSNANIVFQEHNLFHSTTQRARPHKKKKKGGGQAFTSRLRENANLPQRISFNMNCQMSIICLILFIIYRQLQHI
jgi:hypothetical protein